MYFTLPPAPATCKATLKSLPECGPTARSRLENVKLGVITDVMMPFSWFGPATPDRNASDWKILRVLSLNVVTDDRDSEYDTPTRVTPVCANRCLNGSLDRHRKAGRRLVVVRQQRLLRIRQVLRSAPFAIEYAFAGL